MKKQNRRQFIQHFGAASAGMALAQVPPVAQLIETFLNGLHARASEQTDSFYIALSLLGAPSRWTFDHFLKTRSTETMVFNHMIGTRFTGANGEGTEYFTVPYKGLEVPWLWSTSVQGSQGPRALSELLDHMIVFRGYGTGIDGHPNNHARQFAPIGALGSISGYMADRSNRLMATALYPTGLSPWIGYRSMGGRSATPILEQGASVNIAKQMLDPFIVRGDLASVEGLRRNYSQLIEEVSRVIQRQGLSDDPGLSGLFADHESAIRQLKDGFEDLDSAWPQLFQKYQHIVESSYRQLGILGLSDRPIMVPDLPAGQIRGPYGLSALFNSGATLINSAPEPGQDMRHWIANSDNLLLIQGLAFAEFVVTRGLSQSLHIMANPTRGFVASLRGMSGPQTFSLHTDEHDTGKFPTLFSNSCFFRGLGAGLLELTSSLKNAKLFDKTVIHLASDFGRSPIHEETPEAGVSIVGPGSDHLFDGMISSVITGLQKSGPMVLGNILRSGSGGVLDPKYSGTYGHRAPTNVAGSSLLLTPSHVASSIGALLRWRENPYLNTAPSLVQVDDDEVLARASSDMVDG